MNKKNILIKIFILFLSLFYLFSCTDVSKSHVGEKGEPCYEDDSCDKGLKCTEGVNGNFCSNPCENIICSNHGKCSIDDNDNPICICDPNYTENELNCNYDCTTQENSKVNEANNDCICLDGFIKKNEVCVIENNICDGIDCSSHGNCLVANEKALCNCDPNYLLSSDKLSCNYDCTSLEHSQINDTNDGCICDTDYKLSEEICLYDCSNKLNSKTNEANNGCKCISGFHDLDGNCVKDSECLPATCNNGSCNDDTGEIVCSCINNYGGEYCDECVEGFQDNNNNGECLINCSSSNLECDGNSHCDDLSGVITCICNDNFHKENGACVANVKLVNCTPPEIPENSSSINEEVSIVWDNGWSTPANCDWTCNENFHTEDNLTCLSNSKNVECNRGQIIANAHYIIEDTTINWNVSTNSWSTPANCDWSCDDMYKIQNNSCVPLCTDVLCFDYQECNPSNGECRLKDGRCVDNLSCHNRGEKCNSSHQCVPLCSGVYCLYPQECNPSNGICEMPD